MSDEVRDFYQRFPYPLAGVKDEYALNGAAILRLLDFEVRVGGFRGWRILDAGCGTGHRILEIARQFPEARITAFDIAPGSIELARRQACRDGISNAVFEVGDITTFDAEQQYDLVIANGVLHHLPNPAAGARNLSRLVKETGFMYAFLVHSYGEHDKMLQRDLLRTLLGDRRHDYESGIALMRELGYGISSARYGQSFPESMDAADELSRDADSLLNPVHTTLTFGDAEDLWRNSGLDWSAIDRLVWEGGGVTVDLAGVARAPMRPFRLETYLDSPLAKDCFQRLDARGRLRVIELVFRPTGFILLAGSQSSLLLQSKRIAANALPIAAAAG